jgi:putative ABC transport system ATP-binding protein
LSSLIEIQNITKTYQLGETTVNALRGISLNIDSGGIAALMGPSGSGKSTLLNLMGALDTPSSGSVSVNGVNLAEIEKNEQASFRNTSIGFIFQNFNLVPVLTTLENVMLPAQLGRSENGGTKRARKLLEQVGLKDQMNQSVNRLSGGQMQRVAIARALMNNPPIILADEPTANLDHKTADTVLTVLQDCCKEAGATVIIATHDPQVLDFCSRIIQVRDGLLHKDEATKH